MAEEQAPTVDTSSHEEQVHNDQPKASEHEAVSSETSTSHAETAPQTEVEPAQQQESVAPVHAEPAPTDAVVVKEEAPVVVEAPVEPASVEPVAHSVPAPVEPIEVAKDEPLAPVAAPVEASPVPVESTPAQVEPVAPSAIEIAKDEPLAPVVVEAVPVESAPAPVEPIAPVAPVAPVEVVAPVSPVAPVEPVAPVASVEPVAPVAPVVVAAEPVPQQHEQTQPTQSTQPESTVAPTSTPAGSSSSSSAPAPAAAPVSSGPVQVYITPDADRPIVLAESGFATRPPVTAIQAFKETATKNSDKIALSVKRNETWKHWTWADYYNQSVQFARALLHFKFQPSQTVSILGFNSPEWFIADLGAIAAGGLAAGIYTTNGPDACAYIVDHSKSVVVVVENESQLKKILQVKDKLPSVQAIVQWSGVVPTDMPNLVYSWDAFLALGENVSVADVDARIAELKPSKTCTLIYTSGTTGPPKAVMLSHDNLTYTAAAAATAIKCTPGQETVLSYLPLSHVAAQLVDIHGAIFLGAHVWFAQPDALKGSLGATLKEVRPTIFFGVPRVWEKVQEKMVEIGKTNPSYKKKIAAWARGKGMKGAKARQSKQGMPWGWTIARVAVFDKVKATLGLDRAHFLATAAAPMPEETSDFFMSLNIPICDVYGMSEVAGPTTVTPLSALRPGSIGLPVPGIQLKIDNPDEKGNGEICWRGRSSFLGYMHNEKETRETFDGEGWLHTGDIGRLDEDGYLYITGRIKELIITAGGENIPPVLLEDDLKSEVAGVVSNLMAVGDKRKFLACLITLKAEPVPNPTEGQYPFTNNLSKEALSVLQSIGSTATTIEAAKQDPALKKWITEAIGRSNKRAVSSAQQIRAFAILDQDFAIENETLTPTMKLKRRIVLQKYAKEIDEMYIQAEKEFNA